MSYPHHLFDPSSIVTRRVNNVQINSKIVEVVIVVTVVVAKENCAVTLSGRDGECTTGHVLLLLIVKGIRMTC